MTPPVHDVEEITGAAAIDPGIEDVVANSARNRQNPEGRDQTMVINMGPQHPSTHGVLRLVLEIDGETIVSLAPDIGYLHTGIEKTCEAKFYQQVVPLTDRIDYLCPMTNNLAYCLAVEKLLGLEIPERAQYLRVLLNELTRVQSHLVWLGTHAMDIGALTDLPLLLARARRHHAHLRERLRPAHDDQLLPHRRPRARTAAGLLQADSGLPEHHAGRASTSTKTCSPATRSG